MDGLIQSRAQLSHAPSLRGLGAPDRVSQGARLDASASESHSSEADAVRPVAAVLESYGESDVVEGRVTKVVTFGAFVEILPGVEGLVHISELANHHVENPREVVSQGDPVNVLVLEIDGDRRRLSLSLKRVEDGAVPVPRADGAESVHSTPDLKLSEEAFPTTPSILLEDDLELIADEVEEPEPAVEPLASPENELADESRGRAPSERAEGRHVASDTATSRATPTKPRGAPQEGLPDDEARTHEHRSAAAPSPTRRAVTERTTLPTHAHPPIASRDHGVGAGSRRRSTLPLHGAGCLERRDRHHARTKTR